MTRFGKLFKNEGSKNLFRFSKWLIVPRAFLANNFVFSSLYIEYMDQPFIIEFQKIGSSDVGYISVAENQKNVPFDIKRVFWSYHTPDNVVRGRHAHHKTEMVLIATLGRIIVNTEMPNGDLNVFSLESPNQGLYLPKYCWHTMQYSHIAVQLVLASELYKESDYIRNYDQFKSIKTQH